MRRRTDAVSWIYDHRAGVFALVTLALVMAILFVGSKIIIRTPQSDDAIVVDLRTVEELREEARRLQREVTQRQSAADAAYIRNAVSNEGAAESDERSSRALGLTDRFDDAAGRMSANRDAWDQGLRDIEAMRSASGDNGDSANVNRDSRAKGTVQVSFSLINPLRYSADLVNPGYRCERGGEVTVQITVSRGGDVVAAAVDRASSAGDDCMFETALDAARRSRFNVDSSAPERHTGTITYLFIPQ
jgi:TonB family protein